MDLIEIQKLVAQCESESAIKFAAAEKIALANQQKVLNAFRKTRIAPRHFEQSSGYAYDDQGRAALSEVFRLTFNAEAALASPLFASGTHAISTALFGLLRPSDTCLSVSGVPYDTLNKATTGQGIGSLRDFGIEFKSTNLLNGRLDFDAITSDIKKYNPAIIYIQRSKGYNWRKSFSVAEIGELVAFIRNLSTAPIIVDNCYGEFVEEKEPLEVGANLIIGSLIKNPGGGLAPTGGYIAGDTKLIAAIEGRYSAPGVGFEIGACPYGYKSFFQGFFMAPHTVLQSVKSSILFGSVFSKLGYEAIGTNSDEFDIVRAIKFKKESELLAFCRAVQDSSPIDGHVVPYPADMPGYEHQIIMAAGTFVQGASIELSADSPIREPFIAYVQGALTYEHAKLACINCAKAILALE